MVFRTRTPNLRQEEMISDIANMFKNSSQEDLKEFEQYRIRITVLPNEETHQIMENLEKEIEVNPQMFRANEVFRREKRKIEDTKKTSIYNDSFYGPLLAKGTVPNEDQIPERLLEAMAIFISRSTGIYIDPTECRTPAALVALTLGVGFSSLCQIEDVLHN